MARVYISVGTNIEREKHLRSSLRALRVHFGRLFLSSVYESQAVGFEGAPFYNLVVGFDTERDPQRVNRILREIERDHGRDRSQPKFSARSLDLDLLLYDDLVVHEPALKLPRDEILEYAFVLQPLAEIAGERRHPLNGRRFRDLWAEFDPSEQPLWRVNLSIDQP